jgi:two-component system alkaline phosphatase synthesis response regulator PhoP
MIYLVEDDHSIQKLVIYTLKSQGFEAEGFTLPSQFEKAMAKQLPSLIILDIMLPEVDGLTILKKIRSNPETAEIPVILLTAKSSEYDKIFGLDSGADDYVAKPFSMMELLARIKALLRRTKNAGIKSKVLSYRDLVVNLDEHVVKVQQEPVVLTRKEFEMLRLLLENKGHVLTRDQLLTQIWGYDFDGESRTVDVHVRTLRSKIEPCGNYIETVRGVGYKIGGE